MLCGPDELHRERPVLPRFRRRGTEGMVEHGGRDRQHEQREADPEEADEREELPPQENLGGEDDVVLLFVHRRIDGGDALLATNSERDHQLREDDRLPQWHERQIARELARLRGCGRWGGLWVGHFFFPSS